MKTKAQLRKRSLGRETLDESQSETAPLDALLSPGPEVGQEMRELRKTRRLTLDALSSATQLSKGHLSQIERGVSSPSVRALHSISRALGVTISWFFPKAPDGDPELSNYVVRSGQHRALTFESGVKDELLSPNLGRQLELLRSTLPPGAKSGKQSYAHKGDEAGLVLIGTLDLWIGDRHVVLNTGDSFAFESNIPHRYENRGEVDVVVIWGITPPSF